MAPNDSETASVAEPSAARRIISRSALQTGSFLPAVRDKPRSRRYPTLSCASSNPFVTASRATLKIQRQQADWIWMQKTRLNGSR